VADSAWLLADAAGHYTFVSSISVYQSTAVPGLDETAPLGTIADEGLEEITAESYGPLKGLCEQVVERHFPERACHVRAGLIVGPHDPSDRFTYWPQRFARGGEVLAPGAPDAPVQFVDARDLAGWMVRMAAASGAGTFNATGPQKTLTMGALLAACQEAGEREATLTWVPDEFLLAQDVGPWMEMPLWVPATDDDAPGFMRIDCRRAFAAGLSFRPVAQTVRDTLIWANDREPDGKWGAGMTAEKETAVLQAWHARGNSKQKPL
jgi:2'-hydroxyisoflavone reductase